MRDFLSDPIYFKTWTISSAFLFILMYGIMATIYIVIPKEKRLRTRLFLSLSPYKSDNILKLMGEKVRKSHRLMLYADFGFMLGVFGLLISLATYFYDTAKGVSLSYVYCIPFIYLVSDFLEGTFGINLLKGKLYISYFIWIFFLIKWAAVIYSVYYIVVKLAY